MSDADLERHKSVRLTTRGRKSGQPRTVTIWFVPDGTRAIAVQHVTAAPAHWYRNLCADPAVTVDFGAGPIAARATPLDDPDAVRDVLARVRRRYWSAWLIRLLARGATPVAARIAW